MTSLVYTVHIIVCFALIVIVLLQAGKGADMGATFGGASKTVFGPRGAQGPLAKITVGAAVLFMLTNLFLTWATRPGQGNMFRTPPAVTAPATPATPAMPPPGAPAGSRTINIPVGPQGGTINLGGPGAPTPGAPASSPAPGAPAPAPAPITIPVTPPASPAPAPAPSHP